MSLHALRKHAEGVGVGEAVSVSKEGRACHILPWKGIGRDRSAVTSAVEPVQ